MEKNEKKTSLERYVLQRFLTEILEVANVRLARLTRGRYQFEVGRQSGELSKLDRVGRSISMMIMLASLRRSTYLIGW